MVWTLLLYLVSVLVPLVVTLETLVVVSRHESLQSSQGCLRSLILQLKYWSLYGIVFGLVPGTLVRGVLHNVPFAGLLAVVGSSVLTAEVVRDFTLFLQSQDGKYVFLFSKLNDPSVSWTRWLRYAASASDAEGDDVFVFGEFTRFLVSLASRLTLADTHYVERCFAELQERLAGLSHIIGQYVHSRSAGDRQPDPSKYKFSEGYDMLDDLLLDSRKEHSE